MENASKALIMAAEVMIGVLVLSLMVYLFISFGSNSAQINEQMDETKLAEFNSQYDKYNGKNDVTIYDIVTLANLARENNKYYELTGLNKSARSNNSNYYISILLGSEYLEEKTAAYLKEDVIKKNLEDNDNLNTYKCEVNYSNITGRVKNVKFTKNP